VKAHIQIQYQHLR